MPDLLVVADRPDPLAEAFVGRFREAGRDVAHWSYREAAGRFCVRRNGMIQVEPEVPILVRPPVGPGPWASRQLRFHYGEACSLVWAASALTEAEVVNRPGAWGLMGRAGPSSEVTRRRAGTSDDGAPAEVFSSHRPKLDDGWWLENQADREQAPWTASAGGRGPYRSGRVDPGARVISVVVVGETVYCADEIPAAADLGDRSRAVCAALGLAFATVTWRWYAQPGKAELARVTHPSLADAGAAWPAVADALASRLAP